LPVFESCPSRSTANVQVDGTVVLLVARSAKKMKWCGGSLMRKAR